MAQRLRPSGQVGSALLARAQSANGEHLDRLLEEIDVAMAMRNMERCPVYFGEFCPSCRCDVLPLPNGRCGWCDTQVVDPA